MGRRRKILLGSGNALLAPLVKNGNLGRSIAYTRSGLASYFARNRILTNAVANEARHNFTGSGFDGFLSEGARINSIRNATMQGGTDGVIGSGGAAPTNWVLSISSGLTITVAYGTEDGKNYVDFTVSGTPSGSPHFQISFEPQNIVTASQNQNWTLAVNTKLISGNFTNVTASNLRVLEYDSVPSVLLANISSNLLSNITAEEKRQSYTIQLSNANTTNIRPMLTFSGSGSAVSYTVRIYMPQLELGTFRSSFIPTTTVAGFRNSDNPVIDLTQIPGFNANEGTLLVEFKRNSYITARTTAIQIDDGTEANSIRIQQESSAEGYDIRAATTIASSEDTVLTDDIGGGNNLASCAFSYKANDFSFCLNNGTVQTDNSGSVPSGLTSLRIGRNVSSNLYGCIRNARYIPKKLSDSELAIATKRTVKLIKPSGLNLTLPFDIYHILGTKTYWIDPNYDMTVNMVTPITVYYVAIDGNDSNDGLTLETALATYSEAITKGNLTGQPYEIRMQGGLYTRLKLSAATPTQPINFIGENGDVIISAEWEIKTGFTLDSDNTYKVARSNTLNVVDMGVLNEYGDGTVLIEATDVANCKATPGSWYTDNIDVWVHTSDERNLALDATDLKLMLQDGYLNFEDIDGTVYIKNIEVQGGSSGNFRFNSSVDTRVYLDNCAGKYSSIGDAINLDGCASVINLNFRSGGNKADGPNYHALGGKTPEVIELNSVSYYDGEPDVDNNNGSTVHDGIQSFRFNPTIRKAAGRNIHDIGDGTRTWIVAGDVADSRADTADASIDYTAGDPAGNTIMWLTGCSPNGTTTGSQINVKAGTGSTVYIDVGDDLLSGTNTADGTIAAFMQEYS